MMQHFNLDKVVKIGGSKKGLLFLVIYHMERGFCGTVVEVVIGALSVFKSELIPGIECGIEGLAYMLDRYAAVDMCHIT